MTFLSHPIRALRLRWLALPVALLSASAGAAVGPTLADAPLYSTVVVPANVILDLSVEFPTAVGDAYASGAYTTSTAYTGYFNPEFCYDYVTNTGASAQTALFETLAGYFKPSGAASSRTCSGHWSGNYLNWINTQTIDPLRRTLTGGARIVDTASTTVLQRAYQDSQSGGSNQNEKSISGSTVTGATPFSWGTVYTWNRNTGLNFVFAPYDISGVTSGIAYDGSNLSTCVATASNVATGSGSAGSATGTPNFQLTGGNTLSVLQGCGGQTTLTMNWRLGFLSSVSFSTTNGATPGISGLPSGVTATVSPATLTTTGSTTVFTFTAASNATAGSSTVNITAKSSLGTTVTFPLTLKVQSTIYQAQAAAQVCNTTDASSDLESNGGRCRAYGSNYKPVGLMQKYAAENNAQTDAIRYSAFGYLLDSSYTTTNQQLDGGVLRARMKSVGPYKANPGTASVTNGGQEWDAATGVFVTNPDTADAAASSVPNSGVANYLNKFGFVPTDKYSATTRAAYKAYDSVSELYYMATRYYRNLGNIASHTTTATAITSGEATNDNFPVITTWDDPIAYTCSTNYIIGIGDIHTWNDSNLPGATAKSSYEVTSYAPSDDSAVGVSSATDYIANLENKAGDTGGVTGRSSYYTAATGLGDALIGSIASPSGGWGASQNSFYMAGLAFDAHVRDIRPDITTKNAPITVSTFWLDVMEANDYRQKNQFWMTAKYGGFNVNSTTINSGSGWPVTLNVSGGSPGAAAAGITYSTSWPNATLGNTGLPLASWNTASYVDDHKNYAPDQYYQAASPNTMAAGLNAAFKKITSSAPAGTSAGLGLGGNSVSLTGNTNYVSSYSADWSGDLRAESLGLTVTGSVIGTDTTGTTTIWDARNLLPPSTATGALTYDTRIIATSKSVGAGKGVTFRKGSLSTSQLATLGASAVQQAVVNYLRGDTCNELTAGLALNSACQSIYGTGSTSLGFRQRSTSVLGDITNSQPAVYGAPSQPYADAPLNPGYAAFKSTYASRKTVIYVGANDGMLHAFDGTPTAAAGGKELFAYVPSALFTNNTDALGNPVDLGSLTTAPLIHHFMVDGIPVVRDVDFARVGTAGAALPSTAASDWHTIVVTGLGKGGGSSGAITGGGFVALDVTDPSALTSESALAGKVLWETDPSSLTHMGYSYGLPHIIKTKKYGWTVVVTSGYGNDDGKGYIYLINPKDGSLYETIATGAGTTSAPAGLAQLIALIPNASDFTADSLYAGDLLGNVWRVDLTTTSTLTATKFATLTDTSGKAQPVTTSPIVSIDPTKGTRYVFVGTGQLLSDQDLINPQTETFYAFVDGTQAAFDTTSSFPIARSNMVSDDPNSGVTLTGTQRGFYVDLAAATTAGPGTQASAERINVQMVAADGLVLFAANLYGQNICSKGSTRIFGLNYDSGVENVGMTLLQNSSTPSTLTPYVGYSNAVVTNLTLVNGPSSGGGSSTLTAMWGLDTSAGQTSQHSAGGNKIYQGGSSLLRINWREVPESQQ